MSIVPVRGALAHMGEGWLFRPLKLVNDGTSSAWGVLLMLRNCRKAAKAYLKKRGLPRPAVP